MAQGQNQGSDRMIFTVFILAALVLLVETEPSGPDLSGQS